MLELCDTLRHAPSASVADDAHVPECRALYQLPVVLGSKGVASGKWL
jgi:hypothetical protein